MPTANENVVACDSKSDDVERKANIDAAALSNADGKKSQ
jgi:hypothetical protein